MQVSSFRPKKIVRKWAGLRTFAANDEEFVLGFDDAVADNFFWVAGIACKQCGKKMNKQLQLVLIYH
jgi:glycine/D-amino acid oxidase-like deaminating enzyme